MSADERFWAMVDRSDLGGCWPWKGQTTRFGHGVYRPRLPVRGSLYAHRYAWEFVHGPPAKGQVVRHRCDNASCCNPAHLELGTQRDNVYDMVSRRRHRVPRGSDQWKSVLDEQRVAAIQALFDCKKLSVRAIAKAFNINEFTVHSIKQGITWKHVRESA